VSTPSDAFIQCNGIPMKDRTLPVASHHGFLTTTAIQTPARGGSSYCTNIRQGELQYNTCPAKILHLKSFFHTEEKKV